VIKGPVSRRASAGCRTCAPASLLPAQLVQPTAGTCSAITPRATGDQVNLMKDLNSDYDLITQEQRLRRGGPGEVDLRGTAGAWWSAASWTKEHVDSKNPDTGRQTVLFEPIPAIARRSSRSWTGPERADQARGRGRSTGAPCTTPSSPQGRRGLQPQPVEARSVSPTTAPSGGELLRVLPAHAHRLLPIGGFVATICHARFHGCLRKGSTAGSRGTTSPSWRWGTTI
jgi:hypothetical protein